jgi:hypothetical protein
MKPKILYQETAYLLTDHITTSDTDTAYGAHVSVSVTQYTPYGEVVILAYTVSSGDNPPILQSRDLLRAYINNPQAIRKGTELFDALMIEHGPGLFGQEAFETWKDRLEENEAPTVILASPVTG